MGREGWFPDPYGLARWRWFDGQRWTDRVHEELPTPVYDHAVGGEGAPAPEPGEAHPAGLLDDPGRWDPRGASRAEHQRTARLFAGETYAERIANRPRLRPVPETFPLVWRASWAVLRSGAVAALAAVVVAAAVAAAAVGFSQVPHPAGGWVGLGVAGAGGVWVTGWLVVAAHRFAARSVTGAERSTFGVIRDSAGLAARLVVWLVATGVLAAAASAPFVGAWVVLPDGRVATAVAGGVAAWWVGVRVVFVAAAAATTYRANPLVVSFGLTAGRVIAVWVRLTVLGLIGVAATAGGALGVGVLVESLVGPESENTAALVLAALAVIVGVWGLAWMVAAVTVTYLHLGGGTTRVWVNPDPGSARG